MTSLGEGLQSEAKKVQDLCVILELDKKAHAVARYSNYSLLNNAKCVGEILWVEKKFLRKWKRIKENLAMWCEGNVKRIEVRGCEKVTCDVERRLDKVGLEERRQGNKN